MVPPVYLCNVQVWVEVEWCWRAADDFTVGKIRKGDLRQLYVQTLLHYTVAHLFQSTSTSGNGHAGSRPLQLD